MQDHILVLHFFVCKSDSTIPHNLVISRNEKSPQVAPLSKSPIFVEFLAKISPYVEMTRLCDLVCHFKEREITLAGRQRLAI